MKAIWILAVLAAGLLWSEWSLAQDDLSVLDTLAMDDLVEVEPPPPAWQSIGGPVALGVFFGDAAS